MKKEIFGFALATIIILAVGVLAGRNIFPRTNIVYKECNKKHINKMTDGRFMVIPTNSVDGRLAYNVLFEDETGYDSMYPEEIAYSLVTGKWQYNEMLRIIEEE